MIKLYILCVIYIMAILCLLLKEVEVDYNYVYYF